MSTEYREKGIRCFNNEIFFYWMSIQHITFDEYNNSRHFKVSYQDTRTTFYELRTEFNLVLEDQNNGWGTTYLHSSE